MTTDAIQLKPEDAILVVEDLAQVASSVKQALDEKGYANIAAAVDEDEAVLLLQQKRFDYVLINHRPTNDRAEALQRSRIGERIRQRVELQGVGIIQLSLFKEE